MTAPAITYRDYAPGLTCTVPDCGLEVVATVRDKVCHYRGCSHALFASFDGLLRVAFVDHEYKGIQK